MSTQCQHYKHRRIDGIWHDISQLRPPPSSIPLPSTTLLPPPSPLPPPPQTKPAEPKFPKTVVSRHSPLGSYPQNQPLFLPNISLAVDRYSFKTETPKSNNWDFINQVLADTDYLADRHCFGQKKLFWPKHASFGQNMPLLDIWNWFGPHAND